jgi:putative ABC transport system permease protein
MTLLPFEYGVRNLGRSPARLAAIVLGSALVVSLVVAASAFVRGMERSLVMAANDSNVILLAAGSEESLERSQVDRNTAGIISADVPGLTTLLGVPFVSPEIHVALLVKTDRAGTEEFRVVVRGIEPSAFLVHPRVEIVEGRAPTPGKEEIIVGELVSDKMGVSADRLRIGNSLWFDKRAWTIVGRFRAAGTVMNAEVWAPLSDLQVATKRGTLSGVVVTLDDATFEDLDAFTKMRFDLGLAAIPESEYYGALMKFYKPVHMLIWTTAGLIALGGLLGGLNTMYAAFASRAREIGTLQSLGFPRRAIVVSLVQESILAAAGGTLIGCFLSMELVHGRAVRFSMGVFQLTVDDKVLLMGLIAGLFVGFIGALPPIWRCLAMPIDQALRAP